MRELQRKCHVLGIACRIAAERLQELEAELAASTLNESALEQCLDAIGALAKAANQTYPALIDVCCRVRTLNSLRKEMAGSDVNHAIAAH